MLLTALQCLISVLDSCYRYCGRGSDLCIVLQCFINLTFSVCANVEEHGSSALCVFFAPLFVAGGVAID